MTDVHSCSYYCDRPECIKAQRDELRERLAQPEQKPVEVARVDDLERGGRVRALAMGLGLDQPLYTTPPQRKPLTDEEIVEGRRAPWGFNLDPFTAGVRFAESAHGIKEKNT